MNPFLSLVVRFSGFIGVVGLFLVCAWCIKKSIHKRNDSWESYLKEECEANATMQSSFPFQLLLTIDWNKIPHVISEKCESFYETLLPFESKKMVYLKGLSNTSIKKCYGINFFSQLIQYEETFYQFMKGLIAYGDLLEEENFLKESVQVYEYAMTFDYSNQKIINKLMTYYEQTGTISKLKALKHTVKTN